MIKIVSYNDKYRDTFKELNLAWLDKYFDVEPIDISLLSNPKEEIIDKGGKVFFAIYNNTVVGVVALLNISDSVFELSKMAVLEDYQGLGIGQCLLSHCIEESKNLNLNKIILYSNTILFKAISLYKKNGFVEIGFNRDKYKRSNIKLELIINKS